MRLLMSDRPLNISFKNNDNNIIDLSKLNIKACIGCFACWVKTPGKCIIRDDATTVYPIIAKSEEIIYVSSIKYGSYNSIMKTILERSLATQQAFLRLYKGEIHHVQRDVVPKKATIIAYGNIDEAQQILFRKLVSRNAYNMLFENFKIIFTEEKHLEEVIRQEVSIW